MLRMCLSSPFTSPLSQPLLHPFIKGNLTSYLSWISLENAAAGPNDPPAHQTKRLLASVKLTKAETRACVWAASFPQFQGEGENSMFTSKIAILFSRRQTILVLLMFILSWLFIQGCRKKFSLIFAKWLYTTNFCFIFSISTNMLPPTNLFFLLIYLFFAEYLLQKCLVGSTLKRNQLNNKNLCTFVSSELPVTQSFLSPVDLVWTPYHSNHKLYSYMEI